MNDIQEKIDKIHAWLDEGADDEFDDTFLLSLAEQFSDRGDLSDRQVEALDNIIESWIEK